MLIGALSLAAAFAYAYPLTRPTEVAGWSGFGAWLWVGGGGALVAFAASGLMFVLLRRVLPVSWTAVALMVLLAVAALIGPLVAARLNAGLSSSVAGAGPLPNPAPFALYVSHDHHGDDEARR